MVPSLVRRVAYETAGLGSPISRSQRPASLNVRLLTNDEVTKAGLLEIAGIFSDFCAAFGADFWVFWASTCAHDTTTPCQAVEVVLVQDIEVMDLPGG